MLWCAVVNPSITKYSRNIAFFRFNHAIENTNIFFLASKNIRLKRKSICNTKRYIKMYCLYFLKTKGNLFLFTASKKCTQKTKIKFLLFV